MKVSQKNVRIFEFDHTNSAEMLECIKANLQIMNKYTLAFNHAISQELEDFLIQNNINYIKLHKKLENVKDDDLLIVNNNELQSLKSNDDFNEKDDEVESTDQDSINFSESFKTNKVEIFNRQIRSGEEINTKGDSIFLKDVHNGASIKCGGNLFILGKCEANLEVLGDYIIMREFCNGRIMLHNCIVAQNLLDSFRDDTLKHVYVDDGLIEVNRI